MFSNQMHSLALSHSGKSRNLIAHKTDGAWYQHFILDGKFIKNERGLVLDVSGSKDRDGQMSLCGRRMVRILSTNTGKSPTSMLTQFKMVSSQTSLSESSPR